MHKFLITGGAGFIGSAVVRFLIEKTTHQVLSFDNLTYAGNVNSLLSIADSERYRFVKGDVCDKKLVTEVFNDFQPNVVMHLAAETHVDRSIDGPSRFIETNIVGTSVMLECALEYWTNQPTDSIFCFHHISTDEVYGSLDIGGLFTESTSYNPSSPYSASKASSDHLVRSWHRTYGLPTLITNCSNNYGPYQFPEKLIPLMILNALGGKKLPIYGNGLQIRDWLYVEDHARALYEVVMKGKVGDTYNIGGHNEKTNLEVVQEICEALDELRPRGNKKSYKDLMTFVADRPGHDQRYAIDATKIEKSLGWVPEETFETGLKKTVDWYLANDDWCRSAQGNNIHLGRIGLGINKSRG